MPKYFLKMTRNIISFHIWEISYLTFTRLFLCVWKVHLTYISDNDLILSHFWRRIKIRPSRIHTILIWWLECFKYAEKWLKSRLFTLSLVTYLSASESIFLQFWTFLWAISANVIASYLIQNIESTFATLWMLCTTCTQEIWK